jgi:hypothetical protein
VQQGASPVRVYHRKESPSQTSDIARQQETSGELWGYPSITSGDRPAVKAYGGRLPDGERGIEFMTDVEPDLGSPPGRPEWSESRGPRPGVRVEGGIAKIRITVTKNTQI